MSVSVSDRLVRPTVCLSLLIRRDTTKLTCMSNSMFTQATEECLRRDRRINQGVFPSNLPLLCPRKTIAHFLP
ncbi:hypothetical protein KUCAC02_034644, partial [Chaenocephalus aceratus]